MSAPAIAPIYLTHGQLALLEAARDAERVHVVGPQKTAAIQLEFQGLGLLAVGDDGWHFAINDHGRDQLRIRA